MIDLFFYLAIVSKSLLIVLGTLPILSLPAKNDREKRRKAGIPMYSRLAQSTQQARVDRASHRPFTSIDGLPAIIVDCIRSQTARGVPAIACTPRLPVSATFSLLIVPPLKTVFRFSVNRTTQAVCPCQGTWRDNLQLRLCVKCPIVISLACRRSLDNSCPPRSSRNQSGKEKIWQGLFSLGSAPCVRAGERHNCAASQLVIECAT